MNGLRRVALAGIVVFLPLGSAWCQTKGGTTFLLEDMRTNQWCSYHSETAWKVALHDASAKVVGALHYADDHLSTIGVTETDESGDWTVYDTYTVDGRGRITGLARLINVLPGDRSVSQTFRIDDGQTRKTATVEKDLTTGKVVPTDSVWVPDLPINRRLQDFPFAALLKNAALRPSGRFCIQIPAVGSK